MSQSRWPCRLRLDATHNAKPGRKRPDQRRLQAQLDEAGRTRAAYSVDRAARLTRTALFPEHREVYQPQIGLQHAGGFMVIEATEAAPCSARQPEPGRLRKLSSFVDLSSIRQLPAAFLCFLKWFDWTDR